MCLLRREQGENEDMSLAVLLLLTRLFGYTLTLPHHLEAYKSNMPRLAPKESKEIW